MKLDSSKILTLLRSTPKDRKRAIVSIAQHNKLKLDTERHVIKNSGTKDDATMIFHDAIVVFTKKVFLDKNLTISNSVEGFIYGIVRNLWLNELRKKSKHLTQELDVNTNEKVDTTDIFESLAKKEDIAALRAVMNKLGSKCKEVLIYWAGGYSMNEISKLLSYASDGMVRKKKHHCYKQLIELMIQDPNFKAQFKNKK